jgi:hypothetical protein
MVNSIILTFLLSYFNSFNFLKFFWYDLQITQYFYHSVKSETYTNCAEACGAHKSRNIATFDSTSKICYLFQDINSERVKNSNYVSFKNISVSY